jgi:hypothetical protein
MTRYKHGFEECSLDGNTPSSFQLADPNDDRSSTHVVNLEKTIFTYGPWAVPGVALAKLLGLVEPGETGFDGEVKSEPPRRIMAKPVHTAEKLYDHWIVHYTRNDRLQRVTLTPEQMDGLQKAPTKEARFALLEAVNDGVPVLSVPRDEIEYFFTTTPERVA